MSFQSDDRNSQYSYSTASNDYSSENTVQDFLGGATFDPSKLHPMANLGGIDYLNLDDQYGGRPSGAGHSALPSRGWTDDLCYGTGTTYLIGLSSGGIWGFTEGIRKASLPSNNFRIRLNAVLNSMTKRGPFVGNSVGVLAMMYNGINSMIGASRGKHDMANSVAAGALSGIIFRSTAGVRAAGTAGAVCATVAGVWSAGKKYIL
ncbi:uncharacterized protein VTP21DRAFT_10560 [Calcarisporiella thermophila]|uniref:uncharacterized protein n=1 Tax=Calcarisporiella thermophila TaxID=911321 RepID=UPI003743F655